MYNFLQKKNAVNKQLNNWRTIFILLSYYVGIAQPKIKNDICHYIFIIKNNYIQRVTTHNYIQLPNVQKTDRNFF